MQIIHEAGWPIYLVIAFGAISLVSSLRFAVAPRPGGARLLGASAVLLLAAGCGDSSNVDAPDLPATIGSACNANGDCAAGAFCEFPVAACRGPGVCVAQPAACGAGSFALCGCDQSNYLSECLRQKAAASKLHDGICQLKVPCFTLGEAPCRARPDCAADYCVVCSCTPQWSGCRDMLT